MDTLQSQLGQACRSCPNISFIGIIFAIFLTDCSLFREKAVERSAERTIHEMRREKEENLKSGTRGIRISSSSDSSQLYFHAEIFPEGSFTYSPLTGFSGKANRVLLNGNLESVHKSYNSARLVTNSVSKATFKESEKLDVKNDLVVKDIKPVSGRWMVWVGGVVFLFGMVWFLWKGYRSN